VRRILTLCALAALMLAGAAVAQDKATYVGSAKCKMCHNKADAQIHTTWMATKHAKAIESLVKSDDKVTAEWAAKMKVEVKGPAVKAEACLKCHAVPGYTGAEADPFAGVGCESCHGPGSAHIKSPMAEKAKSMQPPPNEATCKTCHTAAASPKFDYAVASKTGLHAKKAKS
jgi:hypothetical protein